MKGLIYKLKVGNFWYVGQSKQKFITRYKQHKRDCFKVKGKGYNNLKYKKFRELGVNQDNWDEMVKGHIIYECELNELMYYEYALINVNDEYNLNTAYKEVDEYFVNDYKEWGILTAEDIKKYRKKWYEDNKDYSINWRENNKNKYNCECCKYNTAEIYKYNRHLTSKKHLKNSKK